ncbi:MAG: Maf family protein, partial [Planctomycetota bacterium]|nr:Maf family protein [Planctomycetota bacterium]
ASKRRSKILSECGIPHRIVVSKAKEILLPDKGAVYNVLYNACLKAKTVAKRYRNRANSVPRYVLGADTLVSFRHDLIAKPRNKQEAKQLLTKFSGKTIRVYTGLCLIDVGSHHPVRDRKNKTLKSAACSIVKVKKIDNKMADDFLKIAGPFDKAGGFSIEGVGSFIFDDIRGSFYNVLGLPTMRLYELFKKMGIDLIHLSS